MVGIPLLKGCKVLHRSKRSPFVQAYLEGIPKPEKVIDRIAGADLRSSTGVDFFTPAPRYVDVRREQRLSTMFFHHILYPAGGARAPYQPVVVRGARALRRRAYPVPRATPSIPPPTNPLEVPREDSSSSSLQQCLQDTSEALWASSDPAVPTFFFSPRDSNSALFHPHRTLKSMQWNIHEEATRRGAFPPSSSSSTTSAYSDIPPNGGGSANAVERCDSALSLLVGTLESYLNEGCANPRLAQESFPSSASGVATLSSLTANSSSFQQDKGEVIGRKGISEPPKQMESKMTGETPSFFLHDDVAPCSPTLARVQKLLNDGHAGFFFFCGSEEGNRADRSQSFLKRSGVAEEFFPLFSCSTTNEKLSVPDKALSSSGLSAHQQARKVLNHVMEQYWRSCKGMSALHSPEGGPKTGYVMLQLPEEALVKLSFPTNEWNDKIRRESENEEEGDCERWSMKTIGIQGGSTGSTESRSRVSSARSRNSSLEVCRLSGGVEPFIPFAVGRPLSKRGDRPCSSTPSSCSTTTMTSSSSPSSSLSSVLFPHIQFLARVRICGENRKEGVDAFSLVKKEREEEDGKDRNEEKVVEIQKISYHETPEWWSTRNKKGPMKEEGREYNVVGAKSSKEHCGGEFASLAVAPPDRSSFNGIIPGVLGTHLDPIISAQFRTVTEKRQHIGVSHSENKARAKENSKMDYSTCSSSSFVQPSRVAIGREDAELYFIPYRALVLTILVPSWAEEMCWEQNRARVRKQGGVHHRIYASTAGLPHSPSSFYYPRSSRHPGDPDDGDDDGYHRTIANRVTRLEKGENFNVGERKDIPGAPFFTFDNGRITWNKKVHLQNQITQLSACSKGGMSHDKGAGGHRVETGHLAYEVRALPGDVIYIPRGWGMEVRRVLGSRITTPSSSSCISSSVSLSSQLTSEKHLTSRSSNTKKPQEKKREGSLSGTVGGNESRHCAGGNTCSHLASGDGVQVEVDGFFVLYRPYPVLTNEQAAVYVSANYAQSDSITEFYEQGGNKVYHHYE